MIMIVNYDADYTSVVIICCLKNPLSLALHTYFHMTPLKEPECLTLALLKITNVMNIIKLVVR